jgi:GGDEF domain-containing protein
MEAAHTPVGLGDTLERVLAAQTRRSRSMSALMIIPIVAVLAGEVRPTALVVWAGLASFESLLYIAWSLPGASRVGAGEADAAWSRRAPLHAITFGLVWGSLPLLTLEAGRPIALWLTLIISLAVLTMYVVSTASSRRQFALGGGPIIGQFALALWISDDAPGRMAVLALGYAGVAVAVHAALRRHLVESVRSQQVAESLAETLNTFMADRDPPTQLLNRRSFISRLDAVLATHAPATVTVEVANVRRLTAMNELYGEQFGDALIAHVGGRLAGVEQHGGLAARLSGDEFVVATFGSTDAGLANCRSGRSHRGRSAGRTARHSSTSRPPRCRRVPSPPAPRISWPKPCSSSGPAGDASPSRGRVGPPTRCTLAGSWSTSCATACATPVSNHGSSRSSMPRLARWSHGRPSCAGRTRPSG